MKSCCKVTRKAKKAYRNSCMETHKMHIQRWLTFLPMSTNVCWPLLLNFLPCFYNNIISNIRSTDHNVGYPAGHPVRGAVHTHQTNPGSENEAICNIKVVYPLKRGHNFKLLCQSILDLWKRGQANRNNYSAFITVIGSLGIKCKNAWFMVQHKHAKNVSYREKPVPP